MAYVKTNWQDGVAGNTKIDATKLNNMEDGIEQNDVRATELSTFNDSSIVLDSSNINFFTPTSGSSYVTYGKCYYYKKGSKVHVHIGISDLTANTNTAIYTLPEGFRPNHLLSGIGVSGNISNTSFGLIDNTGLITVRSPQQYALIQIEFDVIGS